MLRSGIENCDPLAMQAQRCGSLSLTHKLETMARMIPIGPTGRDRIAQGKARNERRPGFHPDLATP